MHVSTVSVEARTSIYLSDSRVGNSVEVEFLHGTIDYNQGVLICSESLAVVSLNCVVPPLFLNDP